MIRWVASLGLAVVLFASPVRADEPDQLFSRGLALMEEGKFEEALVPLAEAQARDPGIGTEFNIALCYERLGKLPLAWMHYTHVADLAHASGKTAREEKAREKVDALKPQLAVFVVAAAEPTDLIVKLDGSVIGPADWAFVPIEAGAHEVLAEQVGRKPWTTRIEAPPAGTTQTIAIPRLEPEAPPPSVVPSREATLPLSPPRPSSRRTIGLVVGGVGVAGAIAATVTGIMLLQDKSRADAECRPDCASARGVDAVTQGKTLLPINIVAWAIAVAGLGAGGYLLLSEKLSKHAEASGFRFQPFGL